MLVFGHLAEEYLYLPSLDCESCSLFGGCIVGPIWISRIKVPTVVRVLFFRLPIWVNTIWQEVGKYIIPIQLDLQFCGQYFEPQLFLGWQRFDAWILFDVIFTFTFF